MIENHSPSEAFVGRSEILEKIAEALLPTVPSIHDESFPKTKSFALCGPGGIGKTEVAINYIKHYQNSYNAIFWVSAENPTKLEEGFSKISVALGIEDEEDAKDQVLSTVMVKGWLANPHPEYPTSLPKDLDPMVRNRNVIQAMNWLIVFDNLQIPEDLHDFWPEHGQGSVLITSRDPSTKYINGITSGMDLAEFSTKDAAELLLKLTGSGSDAGEVPQDAMDVARRLGGFPLGLLQMAGVIRRNDFTFAEFLRRYEEKRMKELHSQLGHVGMLSPHYRHTLASVWALETLEKEASSLLDVLSLLDPDSVSEDLLIHGVSQIELLHYPRTVEAYEAARVSLTKQSLIKRDREKKSLQVHRLIQDAARARMSPKRLFDVFSCTVVLLSAAWPYFGISDRHNTSRWPRCESLLPGIVQLYDLYTSFVAPEGIFLAELRFAQLMTDTAW
jgi:hypothetical protein